MQRHEQIAIHGFTLIVALVTWKHLALGPCFADCGDLQLGAGTAGIMHPPGYAVYVTIGYLLSAIPGFGPATTISLACWGSGLLAVQLALRLLLRLGGNVYLGIAALTLWLSELEVWIGFVSPEVYLPTIALVLGATMLACRFEDSRKTHFAWLAALCLGLAVASRPGVILYLVGILPLVYGLVAGSKRRNESTSDERDDTDPQQQITPEASPGHPLVNILIFGLCLAMPSVYAVTFTMIRDRESTTHNYIAEYNEAHGTLPANNSLGAGWERVTWLMTGREYADETAKTWTDVKRKWRWLRGRISMNRLSRAMPIVIGKTTVMVLLVGFGICTAIALVARRKESPVALSMLVGMAIGSFLYTMLYTVQGDGADIMPIGLSMMMLSCLGFSTLLRPDQSSKGMGISVVIALSMIAFLVNDIYNRKASANYNDASAFLKEVDLQSLPENAIIMCSWGKATPLWYAQAFEVSRDDIDVMRRAPVRWRELVVPTEANPNPERIDDTRPIFSTGQPPALDGFTVVPFRNLFRWVRQEASTPSPDQADSTESP
ncbi:MAG: hypothetical protein ACPGXK_13645 [Phycisphaerae bacterium]